MTMTEYQKRTKHELLSRAKRELMPDVAYDFGTFGVAISSDGHGCIWFESMAELIEDMGEPDGVVTDMTLDEFEFMRGNEWRDS